MFLVAATCSIALLYLGHTRDKGEQGSSFKDEQRNHDYGKIECREPLEYMLLIIAM